MHPAVLCGVFLPDDAGGDPLLLGTASSRGIREVLVRPGRPVPESLLAPYLIPPSALPHARTLAEGLHELLDECPHGETLLLYGIPSLLRGPLRAARSDLVLRDVTGAFRIAWPELRVEDIGEMAAQVGISAPHAPRPELVAQTVRACLDGLRETLRYEVPPALLRECLRLAEALEWPTVPLFRETIELATASGARAELLSGMAGALVSRQKPERPPRPDPSLLRHPLTVGMVLGPDGLLARALEGYEARSLQVEMGEAVGEALRNDEVLLVEAGTGVGKSLAYLVPLALHALATGERVVVSTATKTLQDQLMTKDVPLLLSATGLDVRAMVMKGRRNYLCVGKLLARYQEGQGHLIAEDHAALLPLLSWAARSATLDFSELRLDPAGEQWGRLQPLAADPESCLGSACPQRRGCALVRLRERAAASDLIVMNHALFFSGGQSSALPDATRYVFDEAHTLEDIATDHATLAVSAEELEKALAPLHRPGEAASLLEVLDLIVESCDPPPDEIVEVRDEADRLVSDLLDALPRFQSASESFYRRLERGRQGPRIRLEEEDFARSEGRAARTEAGEIAAMLETLADYLGSLAGEVPTLSPTEVPAEVQQGLARELATTADTLTDAAEHCQSVVSLEVADSVHYIERDGRSVRFCAAPIDAGAVVARRVLEPNRTVVLTSATLAVGGEMGYSVRRLGGDRVPERLVTRVFPSEFDYGRQALALIPSDIPDPAEEGWIEAVSAAILRLVVASRGRALVLFTSRAHLDTSYALCAPHLREHGIPAYCQSRTGSTAELHRTFREEVDSVLFATRSFFEGVDVPGEALESVILTRVPFAVPSEPIVEARWRRTEERGGNPMLDYYLPKAVITFRQAMGRLIRSRRDRGCMILLDSRVLRKSYGRWFLEALPGCPIVRKPLETVEEKVRAWFTAPRQET